MPTRRRPVLVRPVFLLLIGAALLTTACDEGVPTESAEVTVMTRNLYLGADIFRLTEAAAPEGLPVIAAEIFAMMEANDFPARAGALADEIEAANPHLVGLQEVELYRIQDPSDYATNPTANATTVHTDFLAVLLDSLDARGLSYTVASEVMNIDTELPAAKSETEFFDIRMTDHDVILARGDVEISNPRGKGFDRSVPYELASGDTVWFERGYTWVDATVENVRFTFVNTHLEVSADGLLTWVQNDQADELIAEFEAVDPVILVGDFNTGPGDNPYGKLTGTWTDVWAEVGSGQGPTCCQPENISNAGTLTSRIDLVLFGGAAAALSTEVVGDEPADQTAGGLWPSDHAGVVATLRVEN